MNIKKDNKKWTLKMNIKMNIKKDNKKWTLKMDII